VARALTAGTTRKSHHSRKTQEKPDSVKLDLASAPVDEGSSSLVPAIAQPPAPSNEAMVSLTKAIKDKNASGESEVPTEVPAKQWWVRAPDSKTRKVAEKIMVMKAAGHKYDAIAKKLKTTVGRVEQAVYIARKNGWFDDDDEPVDIEAELAFSIDRKVVRNISASLDGQMTNWQTHEMTLAAAKGRGHFKNHEVSKNEGSQGMSVVAIKVIMPTLGAGDQLPSVSEDQMGGAPLYIEGDVDDSAGPAD
jgi:hypothetical protein